MRSNLDVYAIQRNKDETRAALKNVKKDSFGNILYVNCISKFKLGEHYYNRTYDICFYSEESDIVIFFARDMIKEEEVIAYLDEMGIQFSINRFIELEDKYENDEDMPEFWFAREEYVLIDAIDDSISKGTTSCKYYPSMEASVSLGYKLNDDRICNVEGRFCKGVIVFEDKVVLLVSQNDKRNLKEAEVLRILDRKGIKCKIINDKKVR